MSIDDIKARVIHMRGQYDASVRDYEARTRKFFADMGGDYDKQVIVLNIYHFPELIGADLPFGVYVSTLLPDDMHGAFIDKEAFEDRWIGGF